MKYYKAAMKLAALKMVLDQQAAKEIAEAIIPEIPRSVATHWKELVLPVLEKKNASGKDLLMHARSYRSTLEGMVVHDAHAKNWSGILVPLLLESDSLTSAKQWREQAKSFIEAKTGMKDKHMLRTLLPKLARAGFFKKHSIYDHALNYSIASEVVAKEDRPAWNRISDALIERGAFPPQQWSQHSVGFYAVYKRVPESDREQWMRKTLFDIEQGTFKPTRDEHWISRAQGRRGRR